MAYRFKQSNDLLRRENPSHGGERGLEQTEPKAALNDGARAKDEAADMETAGVGDGGGAGDGGGSGDVPGYFISAGISAVS